MVENGQTQALGRRPCSLARTLITIVFAISATTGNHHASASTMAEAALAPKWSARCNPYKQGTPTLQISWPVSKQPTATGPNLMQLEAAQEILITAYRDGFRSGRFVSLTNVTRGPGIFSFNPGGGGHTAGGAHATPPPPLADLRIVDVATTSQPPKTMQLQSQPWSLTAAAASALGLLRATTLPSVTIQVEGMQPGIRYTVRIPSGPNTVYENAAEFKFTAPACPMDRADKRSEPEKH